MSKRLLPKNLVPREQLRVAREMAGWSQFELAERLGTVQVTISRWETGQTDPSPYYREKLSHLLGKTPEDLELVSRNPSSSKKLSAHHDAVIFDPLIPPLLRLPLIGREHEIASLHTHLCHDDAVTLAIYGLPGVGKTTLACTLAQDPLIRTAFPDGILWAGLGVHPDLQQHLVRWGTLLGLSVTALHALHDGNHEKDLMLAVRGAIGTRRMLLILDDAWTEEEVLAFQIGGPECSTLITTRFHTLATTLDETAMILPELSTEDSLDLLHLLAPQVVAQEEQKILPLIQAVGGLPLALTLIGNHLRLQGARGQTRHVQTALDQLHSIEMRLHLSKPYTLMDQHPSLPDKQPLSLNSIIEVTDQQLPLSTCHAFYALSVLPCKPESFSETVALTVAACSLDVLDVLLDMGLLETIGNGHYTMHQTIADYARLHLDTPSPQERLLLYALTFLELHPVDYELLVQERPILLLALEAAHTLGKPRELVQGVNAFLPFLLQCGNYTQAQLHLSRAQQAALAFEEQTERIRILLHLGDLAGRQGNYTQSQDFLQQGLDLARRLGNTDHLCALLSLLGRSLWKQGNYALAETCLQEGLLLARQMGQTRRLCELLDMLGAVAERIGNYQQAEAYLQEGLTLAREIGDREGICRLTSGLGVLLATRGKAPEAETLLQEGLSIAQQIGYREWACVFLSNLGDLARATHKEYIQAEAYLQEGLLLAREIELHEWICAMLVNLTELEIERENYPQARAYFEESATEAAPLGIVRLDVFVLFHRGLLALSEGQIDEAASAFRDMQRLLPDGDPELQAQVQYGQARLAASQNHLQQARLLGEASALTLEQIGHREFHEVRRWLHSLPLVAHDQREISGSNTVGE